jgi:hypothetical protein
MPKVAEFVYPWSQQSLLILHSDGLAAQWNLNHYPGLGARNPALIAAVLYWDFKRTRDDITVLTLWARKTHGDSEETTKWQFLRALSKHPYQLRQGQALTLSLLFSKCWLHHCSQH